MSSPYRARHPVAALDEVVYELDGWDESLKNCVSHGGVPTDVVDDLRAELDGAVKVIVAHRCSDHVALAKPLGDQLYDRAEELVLDAVDAGERALDRLLDHVPARVVNALADAEDRVLDAARYWKEHVRAAPCL